MKTTSLYIPNAEASNDLVELICLRLIKEGNFNLLVPEDACCRPAAALGQELGVGVGCGEDHSE